MQYCVWWIGFCTVNSVFVVFAAGLGEFKIRDLNDEINKLLREKGHWQDQIKELGGPDYWVWLHNICDVGLYNKNVVFVLICWSGMS